MKRDKNSHGEGDSRGYRYVEGPTIDNPLGTERDLGIVRGNQGGENGRRRWQRKQAHGAGRRDERQRLEVGRWGKSTGGR